VKNDLSDILKDQVAEAVSQKKTLRITGGNSKAFYGNRVEGDVISTAEHTGITEYQASELVVTVRSGTLLSELEAELKANKQMLAFEPPQHSANTTIGGAIACGLSGPRRIAAGAARDFVLGTTIINGKAEKLRFGGQVMKNVAGYDASRLMVGAQGTLGLLLDVSLKVLPMSPVEITLQIETELHTAVKHIRQWLMQGLPISASCYYQNNLSLRLSSTASAVKSASNTINTLFNSQQLDNDFWSTLKNQNHVFFSNENLPDNQHLWRCSHQTHTEFYGETDNQLIEWNGALRWIKSDRNLFDDASQYNGHASRYPIHQTSDQISPTANIFQPLAPALMKVQQRLKQSFDPADILNPGRIQAEPAADKS
jgi:glycolate oxidase FAD binding subunit